MLVPQSSDGSGASRLTAAVVRAPAELHAATATTPAPSISPTHSSVDTVRAVVESKPIAADDELDAISEFVGRVLKRSGGDTGLQGGVGVAPVAIESRPVTSPRPMPATRRTPVFDRMHAHLLEQDLAPDLATRIMEDIARRFDTDPSPTDEAVRAAVLERIAAILPADAGDAFDVGLGRHGPRRCLRAIDHA